MHVFSSNITKRKISVLEEVMKSEKNEIFIKTSYYLISITGCSGKILIQVGGHCWKQKGNVKNNRLLHCWSFVLWKLLQSNFRRYLFNSLQYSLLL